VEGLILAEPVDPTGEICSGASVEGIWFSDGLLTPPAVRLTGSRLTSSRRAVGGWIVIPLVGGSSSGTKAGKSSLMGGVPLGKIRLGGVRGISNDIVELCV